MKKILVSRGAGFIGSHLVRLFVRKYPNYQIYNLDKLTYAGNIENLKEHYYADLSDGYKKIFANLQRKLTGKLRKDKHNLHETFSEEYANLMQNLRTRKDIFVFPSLMKKLIPRSFSLFSPVKMEPKF